MYFISVVPFVKGRRVTSLMHFCCSHTYYVAATMTSVLVSLIVTVELKVKGLCTAHFQLNVAKNVTRGREVQTAYY